MSRPDQTVRLRIVVPKALAKLAELIALMDELSDLCEKAAPYTRNEVARIVQDFGDEIEGFKEALEVQP